jgi:hypothetical protein
MHGIQAPDLINGLFEAFGGLLLWQNVRRIRRDKQVRGTDWRVTIFFTSWGYWNMFYYPFLSQRVSFVGGLIIAFANSFWIFYAFKYRKN